MCAFLHGHFSLTDLPSACVPMSGLFLQFLGSLWRALGTGLVPGPSYRGVGLSFPPLRVFFVPCFCGFGTWGLVVLLPPSGSLHPWMVIGCAVVRLLFLSSSPLVGCLSYPFSRLPFGPLCLSLRLRVFLLGFPVSLGIFDWLSCQQFPLARPPCISVPGSCMAVFDCLSIRRRACIFTLRLVSRRLVGWFVCCVSSGLRLCCWFSSATLSCRCCSSSHLFGLGVSGNLFGWHGISPPVGSSWPDRWSLWSWSIAYGACASGLTFDPLPYVRAHGSVSYGIPRGVVSRVACGALGVRACLLSLSLLGAKVVKLLS